MSDLCSNFSPLFLDFEWMMTEIWVGIRLFGLSRFCCATINSRRRDERQSWDCLQRMRSEIDTKIILNSFTFRDTKWRQNALNLPKLFSSTYIKAISLIFLKFLAQEVFLWISPTGRRTNQFHFFLQLICYTKFRGDFFAEVFSPKKYSKPLNIYLPSRSVISRRLNKTFLFSFVLMIWMFSSRIGDPVMRCQRIHSSNCGLSINFRCNFIKWPLHKSANDKKLF